MTKALAVNTTSGNQSQVEVIGAADTSLTAAASKVPIAGADGLLDASWGVTSGTPTAALQDKIFNALALNNVDPIDQKITAGSIIALLFFTSHNANNWKAATTTHTVASGKKLVLLDWQPSITIQADSSSRRMRLWNVTDGVEVFGYATNSASAVRAGVPWAGDLTTSSKLYTVAADKVIRLELWNSDSNKRANGGYVICREIDV